MINNYIKERLQETNVKNLDSLINVLREESQKIALYSLSKTDFFKNVAFYGGTCLRIFHNLNRYSEDLDFAVVKENCDINLDKYMDYCINDLKAFGFDAYSSSKPQYDSGEIRRRYIKFPIYDIVKEFLNIEINNEQIVSVKFEVSTAYIDGAKFETKLLASPLFATVKCYDYSSLFAGKLSALLTRAWRSREKGRDYYDFMFYLSQQVKFNFNYLKNKLSFSLEKDYSNSTIEDIKAMLIKRFENTDFESVKLDVMKFVSNDYSLDSLKKDFFIASVDLIEGI